MPVKKYSAADFLESDEPETPVAAPPSEPKPKKAVAKKIKSKVIDVQLGVETVLPPKELAPKPTTKASLLKLTEGDLDAIVEDHNMAVPKWLGTSLEEKQKALTKYLNLEKPAKIAKGSALNDPIAAIGNDIENLVDQDSVEKEITALLEHEGVNDFKLGGLLQKLSEVGQFDEAVSFKNYVSERFGVQYRKARYLIANYNGLISAGVSWDEVSGIGWTKLKLILPVLTSENVKEWVDKAKNLNAPSLAAAVRASMAKEAPDKEADEPKQFTTKTFKLAADQMEVVNDAIEDAQKKSGTDHPGVALEYICTEYLANTTPDKAAEDLKALKVEHQAALSNLAAAKQQIAELEADNDALQDAVAGDNENAIVKTVTQEAFYKAAIERHNGDAHAALAWLMGDTFDTFFPMLTAVTITPPEEHSTSTVGV